MKSILLGAQVSARRSVTNCHRGVDERRARPIPLEIAGELRAIKDAGQSNWSFSPRLSLFTHW